LTARQEVSDGRYANAAIGPVNAILKGYIYPDAFKGAKGTQNSSLISSMAFAGIIIGQLCTSISGANNGLTNSIWLDQ
jgi:hypothetical protein